MKYDVERTNDGAWLHKPVAEDTDKLISYGRSIFERATFLGWKDDDGEGPLEYIARMAYETGWDDRKPVTDET